MEHDAYDFSLPKELLVEILLKLPALSLLRYMCVCKSWCSTINNLFAQNLLRNHTNNDNAAKPYLLLDVGADHKTTLTLSYDTLEALRIPYPPIDPQFRQKTKIICCCNGIIFFSDQFKTKWGLWSLTTGQTHLLPSSSSHRLDKHYGQRDFLFQNVGFGFDTKTMDYKVVIIYKFFDDLLGSLVVEIYSLKTNSWTSIPTLLDETRIGLPPEKLYQIHGRCGVFSNGMLSWRASDTMYANDMVYGEVWQGIISVDLTSETIITTRLPSSISHSTYSLVNSMVYKEFFSLAAYNYHQGSYHIWVLEEYGLKDSWKMLLNIRPLDHQFGRVLGSWKNDKVLFEKFKDAPGFLGYKPYEKELFLLDTTTRKMTSLKISFVDKVFNYRF